MKPDTKNYYLALALSVFVVFAWNMYYGKPKLDKDRQAQTEIANPANLNAPGRPGAPNALPPQTVNAPPQGGVVPETPAMRRDRKAILADGPRIEIETPSILGSIALKGASLDDVALKDYRETPDKNSPLIVLLSPRGAPSAYVAESGYFAPAGSNVPLPNSETVWTKSAGDRLTPATPVTLTWDNGKGLLFSRAISVDKDYMFTIVNSVQNQGSAPVTLTPYSLILRQGLPPTSGYSVLHEGFIGDAGAKEMEANYPDIEKDPGGQRRFQGVGGWIGFTDKYWATAVVPDQKTDYDGTFIAYTHAGEKNFETVATEPPLTVQPAAMSTTTMRLFAGAKVVTMLNAYEKDLGIRNFGLLIDWGWFWFATRPMFWLMDGIYKIVGNFGVAIIAVTFLVKLVFFPLANRSYMSMAKMKAAQPQLAALKELYPDDKMKQQQEMMAIYKREKINPHRRLPADGDPDPGLLLALQSVVHHHRDAPGAVRLVDPRPVAARPDQHLQSVWPHPLQPDDAAAGRSLPRHRHPAADHGLLDVHSDEDEPRADRSRAEGDVLVDARHLHLHARHLPIGPGGLLDGQQHADDHPAIGDHEACGRETRIVRQCPGHVFRKEGEDR